jgi:hypothetical protein
VPEADVVITLFINHMGADKNEHSVFYFYKKRALIENYNFQGNVIFHSGLFIDLHCLVWIIFSRFKLLDNYFLVASPFGYFLLINESRYSAKDSTTIEYNKIKIMTDSNVAVLLLTNLPPL